MDHPILKVIAERHDTHLVNHMKASRAIEVQNGVKRSGTRKMSSKVPTVCGEIHLCQKLCGPGMPVEEVLIVN